MTPTKSSKGGSARVVDSRIVDVRVDRVCGGVGGSQPAVHCMSGPQLDRYFTTDDTPDTPAQLARVVSQSKLFARECGQHASSLLPYIGSRNAARDLDVLRAALGDRKLTYLGKSYGTMLGATYAQEFPQRTFSSGYRFVEMSGEELYNNVCRVCHMAEATGASVMSTLVQASLA